MKLRDYQQKSVESIINAFKLNRKVLFQLSTGGGKTFTFCYLAKRFTKRGKVHILVNRMELVDQTYSTLLKLGVNASKITAKQKTINMESEVYVGMVETVNNRIKKGIISTDNIGFLIIDECHRGEFDKLLDYYKGYILGCTATPVRLNRNKFFRCSVCGSQDLEECCSQPCDEWSSPFAMSQIYDTIVTGVSIKDLIKEGNLISDNNHVFMPSSFGDLKTDSSGEYSSESLTAVYSHADQIQMLIDSYNQLCKGKKTMIFANNIKTCRAIENAFSESGIDCLSYDSKSKTKRNEIVEEFRDKRDSVLINVNVFTTGFDVTDVECIIVYRATKSLALWLQMVGRGARPTDKIYKDHFTVIDFGNNIEEHHKWSDDRNWNQIFYNGYGKKESKKKDILDFWDCKKCGFFNSSNVDICEECGSPKMQKKKIKQNAVDGQVVKLDEYPTPTASSIIRWTEVNNQNKNFAYKVLRNKILNLFKFYEVSKNDYLTRHEKYQQRIVEIIRPVYFAVLKSNLPSNNNRTLNHVISNTIKQIDKHYGIQGRTKS